VEKEKNEEVGMLEKADKWATRIYREHGLAMLIVCIFIGYLAWVRYVDRQDRLAMEARFHDERKEWQLIQKERDITSRETAIQFREAMIQVSGSLKDISSSVEKMNQRIDDLNK
jgi:hypothetical protein